MVKDIKERVIGTAGSISGCASILGSWQICHNICLGIVALLGIIGITVIGMPLLFLTKVAVPFWMAAFALLLIIVGFYLKKKCVSNRIIIFNSGLIIAGIPFQPLQRFSKLFWAIGSLVVILSISLFIKDKIKSRKLKK